MVKDQVAIINRQQNRIKELETKLNQNSKNSHLPPSKDSYQVKAAFKKEPGGKIGGRPNHTGKTLEMVKSPDHIIIHANRRCKCGFDLIQQIQKIKDRRQVFDIPQMIHMESSEHQTMSCVCPQCNYENLTEFPREAQAPIQYGSRIKALITLLNIDYKLPLNKISRLCKDLFDIPLNEATIINTTRQASSYLESFENKLRIALRKMPLLHADETGTVAGGHLQWTHVNSTSKLTLLHIEEKRGIEGIMSERSALLNYKGKIVHDFMKSYWDIADVDHVCCGSHIIRELEAQQEDGRKWAQKMKKLTLTLLKTSTRTNKKHRQGIYIQFGKILHQGKEEEPEPVRNGTRGRLKKSKGLNLIERLLNKREAVLGYAFDKNIPFTNNQAERDLRCLKVKLKISGCFRSTQGAGIFNRITSFTSSLRKNVYNVYENLILLFSGYQFSIRT